MKIVNETPWQVVVRNLFSHDINEELTMAFRTKKDALVYAETIERLSDNFCDVYDEREVTEWKKSIATE